MRKFYFFTGMLLFCVLSSYSQNLHLPTDYVRNTLSGKNDLPVNVQGSPYLSEDFKYGKVTVGEKGFSASLRYNALTDVFEIQGEDHEVTSLVKRPDVIVTIEGRKYELLPYNSDNGIQHAYFEVLSDGNISFLKKNEVIFKEKVEAKSSYGQDKPASLNLQEKYFLKQSNNPAREVRLRRKNIFRELENEEVKKYVKNNNWKLKNEDEVIKTVEYYNSIN